MTSPRTRRLFASAAAFALAVTGVAISAPSAEAAPAPRTYTAVMSPATATPGASTAFSVVVKNTSTKISALDRFILTIPSGFTVTGSAATTRTGWTGAVSDTEVKVSTSQPLKYGLLRGQSLTMTFNATYRAGCDTAQVTWVPKADGAIIDPWIYKLLPVPSNNTKVTPTPVANKFVVTSVTDVDPATSGSQVLVATPFTVAGKFACDSVDAPAPASASLLSLTKTVSGASLGVPAVVAASAHTASVDGTYGLVENGVGVTVTWSAGTAFTRTIDVLGAAASVTGVAGTPIPPADLTVPGGQADLGKGATGPVSIVVNACATGVNFCSDGTQVELTANLKDEEGLPLYGFGPASVGLPTLEVPNPSDLSILAPARLVRLCPYNPASPTTTDCPHSSSGNGTETEPSGTNYLYNDLCDYNYNLNSCREYFVGGTEAEQLFREREKEEDFRWYPTYISIKKFNNDGVLVDTDFKKAERCVPLPENNDDPNRQYLLELTNTILDTAAQAAGFCVDVNAITRDDNSFTGDLTIPILFVEDIRARP